MAPHRPLIHRLPLPLLLVPPVLIALAFLALVALHASDGDFAMPDLYSQCHARARLPALSHVPVLGAPLCFLVSFLELLATRSARSAAILLTTLAFLGALLTVSLLESARLSNRPSAVISHPTWTTWLPLSLLGPLGPGLVVPLVLLPAFLRRAKHVQSARESPAAEAARGADPDIDAHVRALTSQADALAIPLAVAAGFYAPAVAVLATRAHPVAVGVFLLYPLWVAAVRHLVALLAVRVFLTDPEPYHVESHPRAALPAAYALPAAAAVLAHVVLVWSLAGGGPADDRTVMARAATHLLEIDVGAVGVAVLYWLLVEAGVVTAVVMLGLSVLLGPGAALCWCWVLRESAIARYSRGEEADARIEEGEEGDEEEGQGRGTGEERDGEATPLLR